jgi:hypothetical protein
MNRQDQERPQHAEGLPRIALFGSDLAAQQIIQSSSEPSETRVLKEKKFAKAEVSDEGWWRLYYKDANAAKYILSEY